MNKLKCDGSRMLAKLPAVTPYDMIFGDVIDYEFADKRPENTIYDVFDKIAHNLVEAYENDSRASISECQRLTNKLRVLFFENSEIDNGVKSFIATEAINAQSKIESLQKLWESMNFDFVDKDERWLQIGLTIKRHSLTDDVPDLGNTKAGNL